MVRKFYIISFLVAVAACTTVIPSCSKVVPEMFKPTEGVGAAIPLSYVEKAEFLRGNDQFDGNRTSATGLGPYFVATSCAGCHAADNRGHPFTILTRFGQTDSTGNKFLAKGGPQLGTFCLPGYTPEKIPAGATSTRFIAPMNAGLGYLEAVPDSQILAIAAANKNNPDGVRGHPNYTDLPDYVTPLHGAIPREDGKYISRFGRKASTYNLLQQITQAFNHDMGITSGYLPLNPYNYIDQHPTDASADPEISNGDLNAVAFYVRSIDAPVQRTPNDAAVLAGQAIFIKIGCETCHKQTLTTGVGFIPSLSHKTIHPYTDLLVHDMGPRLDDHYTEGTAKTAEWRTTMLWGLGQAPGIQGGTYYLLHDGRAHSIEQAIEMHGGEAAASEARFDKLSTQDRASLIKFLKSL